MKIRYCLFILGLFLAMKQLKAGVIINVTREKIAANSYKYFKAFFQKHGS
jgi:hypothetical protein